MSENLKTGRFVNVSINVLYIAILRIKRLRKRNVLSQDLVNDLMTAVSNVDKTRRREQSCSRYYQQSRPTDVGLQYTSKS
jgi:hypothetical protein